MYHDTLRGILAAFTMIFVLVCHKSDGDLGDSHAHIDRRPTPGLCQPSV